MIFVLEKSLRLGTEIEILVFGCVGRSDCREAGIRAANVNGRHGSRIDGSGQKGGLKHLIWLSTQAASLSRGVFGETYRTQVAPYGLGGHNVPELIGQFRDQKILHCR